MSGQSQSNVINDSDYPTTDSVGNSTERNVNKRDPLSLCGDWQQLAVKCYKIIESLSSKSAALASCKELDQSSTLVQISSADEQQEILNYVSNYKMPSKLIRFRNGKRFDTYPSQIWLGVKYGCRTEYTQYGSYRNVCDDSNSKYVWEDGTKFKYTNWDEDSPDSTGATNLCVQMSIDTGKWSDVKCGRKNLVMCEKKSQLNLNSLYTTLRNTYVHLQEQVDLYKQQENVIPIGFIYTQFPNQSSPLEIWPNMNWTEVTDQYSGLFFRAEGSGSEPFGQIQQQNYSHISHITAHGVEISEPVPRYDKKYGPFEFAVKEGDWTMVNATNKQLHSISFYQTSGDNVPLNTAIKVWKRI